MTATAATRPRRRAHRKPGSTAWCPGSVYGRTVRAAMMLASVAVELLWEARRLWRRPGQQGCPDLVRA